MRKIDFNAERREEEINYPPGWLCLDCVDSCRNKKHFASSTN